MYVRWGVFALLVLSVLSTDETARAQDAGLPVRASGDDLALRIGGIAQVRAAYNRGRETERERLGFGIRSMRVNLQADAGERVQLFAQGEGSGGGFALIDLRLTYRPAPHLSLHAGRLITAQPAGFAPTPQSGLDAIDRSVVAVEWGRRTVGPDGRDFGVEAVLAYPQARLRLAVQNGDGSWDRLQGNFRDDVGTGAVPTVDRTGLAVGAAAAVFPKNLEGLEVGGYAGYSTARSPYTEHAGIGRSYATWAVHLYRGTLPGSRPLRFKAEALGIRYEAVSAGAIGSRDEFRQRLLGTSVLGAVRVHRAAEAFARAEVLDLGTGAPDERCSFLTLGASFSPGALRGLPYHRERLTLAWTSRCLDGSVFPVESYGLTLQAQFVF